MSLPDIVYTLAYEYRSQIIYQLISNATDVASKLINASQSKTRLHVLGHSSFNLDILKNNSEYVNLVKKGTLIFGSGKGSINALISSIILENFNAFSSSFFNPKDVLNSSVSKQLAGLSTSNYLSLTNLPRNQLWDYPVNTKPNPQHILPSLFSYIKLLSLTLSSVPDVESLTKNSTTSANISYLNIFPEQIKIQFCQESKNETKIKKEKKESTKGKREKKRNTQKEKENKKSNQNKNVDKKVKKETNLNKNKNVKNDRNNIGDTNETIITSEIRKKNINEQKNKGEKENEIMSKEIRNATKEVIDERDKNLNKSIKEVNRNIDKDGLNNMKTNVQQQKYEINKNHYEKDKKKKKEKNEKKEKKEKKEMVYNEEKKEKNEKNKKNEKNEKKGKKKKKDKKEKNEKKEKKEKKRLKGKNEKKEKN